MRCTIGTISLCRLALALAVLASPAFANSDLVTYQGVLSDASGPFNGSADMSFSLWDAQASGSQVWGPEPHTGVAVVEGTFSVLLGGGSPFGATFTANSALWLEVTADIGAGAQTFGPRVPFTAAPFSFRAQSAASADTTPWAGIGGIPADIADGDDIDGGDATTLDGMDSTDFAGSAHTHAGSDITSSVPNADAAPWAGLTGVPPGFADGTDDVDGGDAETLDGIDSTGFAASAHVHAATEITSGTLGIARLPVGTTASDVAAGDHTHSSLDAADGTPANALVVDNAGNVGIGNPAPTASAKLDVSSTTQGFAMPRMTSAERRAIAAPVAGLQVFDTTLNGFYYWNGSKWDCVSTPAGTVNYFAGGTAPSGYLECAGQSVSTTVFAELFSAIGYTYGGSGGSFNVPDLRGEFVRTWDHGRGVDSGRGLGTLQAQDFKSFSMWNDGGGTFAYSHGPVGIAKSGQSGNVFGGGWTAPAGRISFQWDASEVRPRNVALMACIKY